MSKESNVHSARRVSAEHESAHAVVAAELGLRITEVALDDWPAYCLVEEGTLRQEALIAAAGDVWVEDLSGLALDYHDLSEYDWDAVTTIVGNAGLRALRDDVKQLLGANAVKVRALADALMHPGRLSGTEAHEVLDATRTDGDS